MRVVGVVGIISPFAPLGAVTRGKFVLSSPRGEMGTGEVCRVSLAAVYTGRTREYFEWRPCWDCRRDLWVPGQWCQYSGKNRFIEKRWVQDERVHHVAKHSYDPGKLTPKSNFRDGTLCELWVLLPPLPSWGPVPCENSFYLTPGGKWAQETCAGFPSSGTPREIQANFRVGTVWGF